jgi:hypothetical protein
MAFHEEDCHTSNSKLHKLMRKLGCERFEIELVETVNTDIRTKLTEREGYYQRLLKPTLNQRTENRTRAEEYEIRKCKHECAICGGKYTTRHITEHMKTKKHLLALKPKKVIITEIIY